MERRCFDTNGGGGDDDGVEEDSRPRDNVGDGRVVGLVEGKPTGTAVAAAAAGVGFRPRDSSVGPWLWGTPTLSPTAGNYWFKKFYVTLILGVDFFAKVESL